MRYLVGSRRTSLERLERLLEGRARVVGPAPEDPTLPGLSWGWVVEVPEEHRAWVLARLDSGLVGYYRVES